MQSRINSNLIPDSKAKKEAGNDWTILNKRFNDNLSNFICSTNIFNSDGLPLGDKG